VPIRTIRVTRYVSPLREGGSLPALVEADDDGMYVVKFREAGQGPKSLIAELVCGELARALGLRVPEVVFADVHPDLARTEPDPEISALIRRSAGLNLALDYLPGSIMFDPIVVKPDADLASRIVWFDAFVSNVDRTPRNPNMLMWHRQLWLIDHGAALYFQHASGWETDANRPRDAFALIKNHILRHRATRLETIDAAMAGALAGPLVAEIVALIPDGWLTPDAADPVAAATSRTAYRDYLEQRLQAPRPFIEEAVRVR